MLPNNLWLIKRKKMYIFNLFGYEMIFFRTTGQSPRLSLIHVLCVPILMQHNVFVTYVVNIFDKYLCTFMYFNCFQFAETVFSKNFWPNSITDWGWHTHIYFFDIDTFRLELVKKWVENSEKELLKLALRSWRNVFCQNIRDFVPKIWKHLRRSSWRKKNFVVPRH